MLCPIPLYQTGSGDRHFQISTKPGTTPVPKKAKSIGQTSCRCSSLSMDSSPLSLFYILKYLLHTCLSTIFPAQASLVFQPTRPSAAYTGSESSRIGGNMSDIDSYTLCSSRFGRLIYHRFAVSGDLWPI